MAEQCHVEPVIKDIDKEAFDRSITAFFAVSGMGCPRCALRVRNGLLQLDGVVLADVVLEKGLAGVAYDPHLLDQDDLLNAVAQSGNGSHHVYQAEYLKSMPSVEAWNAE